MSNITGHRAPNEAELAASNAMKALEAQVAEFLDGLEADPELDLDPAMLAQARMGFRTASMAGVAAIMDRRGRALWTK